MRDHVAWSLLQQRAAGLESGLRAIQNIIGEVDAKEDEDSKEDSGASASAGAGAGTGGDAVTSPSGGGALRKPLSLGELVEKTKALRDDVRQLRRLNRGRVRSPLPCISWRRRTDVSAAGVAVRRGRCSLLRPL